MRRTASWMMGLVLAFVLGGVAVAVGPDSSGTSAEPAPGQATPARRSATGQLAQASSVLGYQLEQRTALLHYPGAEYVKVHFAHLLLLPGSYLTVGNPSGTEVHRVDGDPIGTLLGASDTWAMSVTGDTALVTLHHEGVLGEGVLGTVGDLTAKLGATIDKVAHGYPANAVGDRSAAPERTGREESICGSDDKADAVCYKTSDPVMYRRSKAVVRLLINGVELCTAFRVGTGNRLLTNEHCVSSRAEASDTEVWFNYMCAVCGGYEVFQPTKVRLDQVIAADKTLDYTLFSVTNFEQVEKFGYLPLDLRRPDMGEELYIPQHPRGEPMMVAISSDRDYAGNCAVQDNAYDGYAADTDVSYYCDTEGGSSGSPVLSRRTNAVVALHHFGGCPNSGVRLERIYHQIAHLI